MTPDPTAVDLGWSAEAMAATVGGTLVGETSGTVRRVTTDSRSDVAGAAFIALRGDRFDGHDYVDAALEAGAVVAVVDDASNTTSAPRIVVSDTEAALLALAAERRAELETPVIAITGSSGKTSTKDLLAAAIPAAWASPRSYNNEIGVPLTVLATPRDARALVLEVGSRGPGHIAALAPAIRPDVSIVTNLGVAHLEMFGSESVLADAKYELVAMLGPGGTAVVPDGEARLDRSGPARRVTFGVDGGSVSASDVVVDDTGHPTITLDDGTDRCRVTLSVAGAFQAHNAAAAAAAGRAIGIDLETLATGMAATTGSSWRMDVHPGRFTVVNDAYNANPASVRAALDAVAAMPGGRHIAVLGPMLELGPIREQAHREVAEHAAGLGFDLIVAVGEDHGYRSGASELVVNATDLSEAADTLRAVVEPGDVVLVKASRASGLEQLALELISEAAR